MLKTFIAYYKNHQLLFYLDLLAATIMSGLNLLFPVITSNFIDDYIPNEKMSLILTWGLILTGLYLIRMACNYFVNYYKNTFQHGGISLEEMLIPFITLSSK